jgi:uncharacterized lipoprotein YddW (UPF0748 family)
MIRRILTLLLGCQLVLGSAVSAETDTVRPSEPGIRLYGGGIFKTEAQTQAFVEKCAQAGITVLIPGLSAGPSPLWRTELEPYAADQKPVLDAGYDALEALIRHAHKAGIAVYPSVAVYFGGQLIKEHPEWETRDREGRPSRDTYGSETLAYSYPKARQAKIRMLMDLVTGYDIDGILLDRLRYPENTKKPQWNHGYYGYDPPLLDACINIYGFDPRQVPIGSKKWEIFAQLRAETVTAFLTEFREAVRASGSDIRIGGYAAPDPVRRRAQSGRDYTAWARRGLIDDLYLGMYSENMDEARAAIPPVRQAIGHNVMLYTSLSPYNNYLKSEDELIDMARVQLSCDIDGLWVYRTDYVEKLDLWEGVRRVNGMLPSH